MTDELAKLKRKYEIAEARHEAAQELGYWLALFFGLAIYQADERWFSGSLWTALLAFGLVIAGIHWEYKRPYRKAENAYFDAQ
jgi:hypothetical protein